MPDFILDKGAQEVNTSINEQYDGDICVNDGWDDISGALMAAKLDTSSGRLDYDYFNAGVNFNSDARYPNEPAIIPKQLSHRLKLGEGAVFRPHFHWLQEQSARPNMLLGYKITNYGELTTKETDWSGYTFIIPTEDVFIYTSGVLAQITKFPEIDISSAGLSASIDFVLFRDSENTSGLFSGADPVSADVTIKYTDSHAKHNQDRGSRSEYVK